MADVVGASGMAQLGATRRYAQRLLTHELADGRARCLQASCRDVGDVVGLAEVRRLRSQAGRGAAAWLRAIPMGYNMRMLNVHFRIALQWWLHLPLPVLGSVADRQCYC